MVCVGLGVDVGVIDGVAVTVYVGVEVGVGVAQKRVVTGVELSV